jgi:hypothetical protein
MVLGLRYSGILSYSEVNGVTFLLIGLFAFPFFMISVFLLVKPHECFAEPFPREYEGNPYRSGRVFKCLVLLTFAYLVAVLVDKIFLENVFSLGITETRYAAMANGPRNSLLGAVHYFLAGAPVLLACLLLSRRSRSLVDILLWLIVIVCFGSFFLSGGRNSFVVGCIFVFFYFVLEKINFRLRGGTQLRKFGFPLWLKTLSVVGVCYVMYLFVERAEIRGMNLEGAVSALGENYNVGVFIPSFLPDALLQVYYCLVFVAFYVTHSLSYLSAYFDIDYFPMTMGGYSFSIVFRVIDSLAGTTYVTDAFERLLVAGVYLTLPGSIFVDFGFVGVLLMSMGLAWLSVWCVTRAIWLGNGNRMMLASLCLTLIALSPVFSALSVGNGFSIMILLVVVHIIGRRKSISKRREKG